MKIRLIVVAYLKLKDAIPKKYREDFHEHLCELARVNEISYGVMSPKELADFISSLIEDKADKAYVEALREIFRIVKSKQINELIFE